MTFATRSSLHVRGSKRRNSSSGKRRSLLKALAAGIAILLLGCVSMTAVIAGVGRLMALSFEAQSNARSVLGLGATPSRTIWATRANIGIESQLAIVASLSPPPAKIPPAVEASVTLALASPNLLADPDVTGSIGSTAPKLASLDLSSVGRSDIAAPRAAPPPLPLPRTRPQLAALPAPGNSGLGPSDDPAARKTAIYDITAQTVYMPNGEQLEAHSGLGDLMDNPRSVRIKMRGATPPNMYMLKLREALFHGVQAIRMTPVNESEMFGRDGILAHTYMLGPNGQSNGCVSFKDYPRFLRAFLRGEVDRMIVVPRLDKPPTSFARSGGASKAL